MHPAIQYAPVPTQKPEPTTVVKIGTYLIYAVALYMIMRAIVGLDDFGFQTYHTENGKTTEVNSSMGLGYVISAIFAAFTIFLGFFYSKGHGWARITALVLGIIGTIRDLLYFLLTLACALSFMAFGLGWFDSLNRFLNLWSNRFSLFFIYSRLLACIMFLYLFLLLCRFYGSSRGRFILNRSSSFLCSWLIQLIKVHLSDWFILLTLSLHPAVDTQGIGADIVLDKAEVILVSDDHIRDLYGLEYGGGDILGATRTDASDDDLILFHLK